MNESDLRAGGLGRPAERAVGEHRRAAEPASTHPQPELVERASRRVFTAEYKLGVLAAADACRQPGEIGALLRREGLYSSHLCAWRAQRDAGALAALARARGRRPPDPRDARISELQSRAIRAETQLAKAQRIVEVQGNVCALLGELLEPRGASETTTP